MNEIQKYKNGRRSFPSLWCCNVKEVIPASSSSGNTSLDLVVDRMLPTIVLSSI